MTTVDFIKTSPRTTPVKQSRIKRDWMDETHKKHAYQCLPMTAANTYGWEFIVEEDITFQWDGGPNPPNILSGEHTSYGRLQATPSINGMISINMGWVVKTEEPYWTWLSGSPNYFKDGISPLSATIPAWWWPDEVQMNWKIHSPNQTITFHAGEPFCFLNIYKPSDMAEVTVKTSGMWDYPGLSEKRQKYGQVKSDNMRENPWTWTKGIRTGIDADGCVIGPPTSGMVVIQTPEQ
jgi:hypothetical protein